MIVAQTDSSEKIDRTESVEESSPDKIPSSPEKKKRKTKAELKMELKEQKVMEKKLALRRQRTRNRRYIYCLSLFTLFLIFYSS